MATRQVVIRPEDLQLTKEERRLLREMRVPTPKSFSGDPEEVAPEAYHEWKASVLHYMELYAVGDKSAPSLVSAMLRGEALRWWRALGKTTRGPGRLL